MAVKCQYVIFVVRKSNSNKVCIIVYSARMISVFIVDQQGTDNDSQKVIDKLKES